MIGNQDRPSDLSLAQTSLHCSPEAEDVGAALPVGFSDKLSNRSLQGHPFNLSFVVKNVAVVEKQPLAAVFCRSVSAQCQCITTLARLQVFKRKLFLLSSMTHCYYSSKLTSPLKDPSS